MIPSARVLAGLLAAATFNPVAAADGAPVPGGTLTVERAVASPALEGPTARGVKISPDGARVTFLRGRPDDQEQQDLWEYHLGDGEIRLLVDSRDLAGGEERLDEVERARRERARVFARGIVEYDFSPDGRALLFPLGGDLHYLEIGGTPRRLTNTPETETDARISPGGNYVSFVREQNLFLVDLRTGEERALTRDGGGALSFGMAEFVAQEEMYRNTGYWWAPDERRIAWARVDESGVRLIDRYEVGADGVTVVPQRYPFAGSPNAVVRLFVQDLEDGSVREVDLGEDPDVYLARVDFAPDGTLAVQRQGRDQRTLDLLFFDPETLAPRSVLTESQPHWVNLHSDLTFIDGGQRFLWTSERSGYNHVYLYHADGTLERQLTAGDWPVASTGRGGGAIRAVDEEGGRVWFTGSRETPTERHLYRMPLSGGEIERVTRPGEWHEVMVAPGGEFFVDNGQGPERPPYTAIRAADGERLAWILENPLDESHPYHPFLAGHRPTRFGTIETEDGTPLHYRLTLPAGYETGRRHPAVVTVYGGPGVSPRVRKGWPVTGRNAIEQLLARHGYVVFALDNRGTSNRGKAFEDAIHHRLGDVEVRDQLRGLEWLKSQPFVDAQRVGVFGWSYGGYMTLLLLLEAPGAWAAGISGAPVTNWRLYDTHYTERYLGDPDDGAGRYARSSPVERASRLADPLLIVHGMADDNVVFDHAVQMIDALQASNRPFEMMAYPGKRHRITGEAQTAHLWNLYLDFFARHLGRPAQGD